MTARDGMHGATFQDLHAGDVVRFRWRETERTAAVLPLLVFDDHVIVRLGPCGYMVNAVNFVRLVRRGRK